MKRLPPALRAVLAVLPFLLLTGCPAPPPPADTGATTPSDGQPSETTTTADTPTASMTQAEWGDPNGIVIGGFMSLTGAISSYGTSSNAAMGMATEELNAAGGVLGGQKLKLVMEDTASDQKQAVNAARRLLDVHHAKVLVGEVASGLSLAVAPICQSAGVPMLSPSSTNPKLTGKGDYIFRACFTDDQQGAYMSRFAAKQGYKKGAILLDVSQEYSKGLADVISREFPKLGGTIVGQESYQQDDKDFSAALTKLQGMDLDVIFVPGYYTEAGLIIKKARRDLGMTVPFVGGDGWDSPQLVELAGDGLNTACYFVNHYSKTDPGEKVQQFVSNFKTRFGTDPDALAACAYDAIYMVAAAMNAAGSAEPKAIRDALAKTKDFDGVTGKISLDEHRDALKPCVVLGFENQQQKVVDHITLGDL